MISFEMYKMAKNKFSMKKADRKLRICGKYRSNQEVPELRLTGHWFKALGFDIGDRVSITTRERLLIIEPMEVAEPEEDYKAALKEVKQTLKRLSK